ncbi:MAG: NADH-quinone oxidoreductase subunit L [candidate division KSB1 bacterium]|nr:NADH-quinone oxidoreductase subunit L [candidate division KSB1 bacterium]
MLNKIWLIPLFPLVGFVLNGLLGWRLRQWVGWLGSALVGASFVAALSIFRSLLRLPADERHLVVTLYRWIESGDFAIDVSFLLDPLSMVMVLVVTGVGFLIHIYSIGYMAGDRGIARYFSYLNLFTFAMLLLVLADNYLLMFVGWEGVGLCSYLLIGFWYEERYNAFAGRKAFVVNRIGDYGFTLGLLLLFSVYGTLRYDAIFSQASQGVGSWALGAATLLLFVGATGKSAQIPLYVWLPDAMAGPTPVSALIHAATMVTAGVYMVARSHVLFLLAPNSLLVVSCIGVFTALFAASIALTNNDIKRVLAYSTISQLGYMFVGAGVGAFAAGIFHLMTHAFFKALLFLGAGSVMHALAGETDMRKMGGLKERMPVTYWTMLAGTLAIAGVPLFSGFFSKDEILWQSFGSPHGRFWIWLIGWIAAGLTAFYMFRLVYLTFHGRSRVPAEKSHHIHESPPVMTVPLVVLAVLSVVGGYVGVPKILGGEPVFERFLEPVFQRYALPVEFAGSQASEHLELLWMALSVAVALAGIAVAHLFYVRDPGRPERLAKRLSVVYRVLYNKYYVDEIYDALVVQPLYRLSHTVLWKFFDVGIVDGTVNGIASVVGRMGQRLRRIQTGQVQNYALGLLVGVVLIVGYLLTR